MLIIEINSANEKFHNFQSQSHRTECWIDGYIEVPKTLEAKVYESKGYCELIIENDILIDVVSHPEWKPEKIVVPTAQDDTDAILVDHEYRLTLLELEVV